MEHYFNFVSSNVRSDFQCFAVVFIAAGDKKYSCQECEAAFSRSDHLKIHLKTHRYKFFFSHERTSTSVFLIISFLCSLPISPPLAVKS